PALFMTQKNETAARQRGLPPKWTLSVDLYVYAQASNDSTAPALSLNPLLDAIDAAIAPLGRDLGANVQSLGRAVYQAWINGKIEIDGGILGRQAVAIIPVEIVVPG